VAAPFAVLDDEAKATHRSPRTVRPSIIAVAVATAIFLVIVSRGFTFTNDQPEQSRFYENQAHSLLEGRIDVPLAATGDESIRIDGNHYGYFGLTPAILRLPVMVFASSSDPLGEPFLAPSYMTIAFLLAGLAIAGIAERVGIRGWAAGAFTLVGLAGSALMTLSLRALVYEEATLWGVSFALVTTWAALRLLETPSRRWTVLAITAATLSLSARPTVGIGAVAVLGAVAILRRDWVLLVAAPAAALALYGVVMIWKFGAFYPPQDHQINCVKWEKCLTLVRAGSTHPRFIPTNLFQYFRPDLLGFTGSFPWIRAPGGTLNSSITLIGINSYLGTDAMASVTTTMPALLALSFVGLVTASWTRRWLILASCVGPLVTCMYLGATQRYLADFVPTMIIASACGLAYLLSSRWRVVGGTIIAFLGAWSVIVCIALALWKVRAG
jgi:hypothetical protein